VNDTEVERGDLPIGGKFTINYEGMPHTPGKHYTRVGSRDWFLSSDYHIWFEDDHGHVDWVAADWVIPVDGPRLTFYVMHEAWSWMPRIHENNLTAYISISTFPGSEFSMRWYELSSGVTPRLMMFSDSWEAFNQCPEFFKRFPSLDKKITPDEFKAFLLELGFVDTTERKDQL
jgi:hypothetical protein